MNLFEVIAILLVLTAAFGYINHRFVHLPPSVGNMALALVFSLLLIGADRAGIPLRARSQAFLSHLDLGQALLNWMLGFLLFAGGMSIHVEELLRLRVTVLLLAVGSTVLSTFLVGGAMFLVFHWLGLSIPLPEALVFGALISPTDPVAVLSLLKWMRAPKNVETVIGAESLLNDGVGVVLFLTLLHVAVGDSQASAGAVTLLFVRQAMGGALLGLAGGAFVRWLLRTSCQFELQMVMTLALVMATSTLAERLGVSGPIAAVFAGLIVGAKDDEFVELETFWGAIDELLNAVLFVLIGLTILSIHFSTSLFIATVVAIPVVLAARLISVSGMLALRPMRFWQHRNVLPVLVWGGLRGGLAVAMALSLPESLHRSQLVAITYGVVLFSILVQGTTCGRVITRTLKPQ